MRKFVRSASKASSEFTRARTPTIVEQFSTSPEEEALRRKRFLSHASTKESADLIAILQRQEQEALRLKPSDGDVSYSFLIRINYFIEKHLPINAKIHINIQ